MIRYLSPEQVLFIHARLIHETGGQPGVRDLSALLSSVTRPQAKENEADKYPGLLQKAATLFDSLLNQPAFVDGNKRTAITAAGLFLQMNGQQLVVKKNELVRFTTISSLSQTSLDYATAWFWQCARPLQPIVINEIAGKPWQSIANITLVIPNYDEAIAYYTSILGFDLLEDTPRGNGKRWVRVAPPGSTGTGLLLAQAASPNQESRIGDQTGGRVFLFLQTDDFWRDYATFQDNGVEFEEDPRTEDYGIVAVFKDCYGNRWDLLQLNA
ncbi:MAG: type II toxin-antitoxin system death-on-curing family toxin [Leptolinea sp.]